MNYQDPGSRQQEFFAQLQSQGVGLAYFLGSQQELGPASSPVKTWWGRRAATWIWAWCCWNIPWIIGKGNGCGKVWKRAWPPSLPPYASISCCWNLLLEEENAHVQYAAIRGIQVYAVNEEFAGQYRPRVLALYGDWHSWWP
jgi:hypothetical protein